MRKIKQLLAYLCPDDGVDFVLLCSVAKISNGRDYKALPDGDCPVYGSGGIMRYANQPMLNLQLVLLFYTYQRFTQRAGWSLISLFA